MNATEIVSRLIEDGFDAKSYVTRRIPKVSGSDAAKIKALLTGRAKESQYAQKYLDWNEYAGEGNGLTVGSFLNSTLRGAAKAWSSKYTLSLVKALHVREYYGLAYVGISKGGAKAWYPNTTKIAEYRKKLGI